MDGMMSWVKGMVCYSVLAAACMELLPEKFRKYIRLYMGLLFLLLFLSPAAKLLHLEESMEHFFNREWLKLNLEDKAFELELKEADVVEVLKQEYTGTLKGELADFLSERGYELSDFSFEWEENTAAADFGEVTAVTLEVRPAGSGHRGRLEIDRIQVEVFAGQGESREEKALKNELVSFYNIDAGNINVSIQGGGRQ